MIEVSIQPSETPLVADLDLVSLDGLPDAERSLLIVDDDAPLCQRLARAMERRGFLVATAESVKDGVAKADENPPAFAAYIALSARRS